MTYHLLFNGELYAEPASLISPSNSGFRFGHGLFETIKVINCRVHLPSFHFERLFHGMNLLGFEIPLNYDEFMLSQINFLLNKNLLKNARVRLCIAGSSIGISNPLISYDLILQCYPLTQEHFQLNPGGLKIGICHEVKKSCDLISNLKSNNYLPLLIAARHSANHLLDDSLILNHNENIIESTISNVFVVKNNEAFTPPLSDGPVAGIMRRHILDVLPTLNIPVHERSITVEQLKDADEIFLSNALTGIRWVKEFEDIHYSNETSIKLYPRLFNER